MDSPLMNKDLLSGDFKIIENVTTWEECGIYHFTGCKERNGYPP